MYVCTSYNCTCLATNVLTHLKSELNDPESDPSRTVLIRSGAARLFFKSGSVNISHNGQVLFGGRIISLSSIWMKHLIIVLVFAKSLVSEFRSA